MDPCWGASGGRKSARVSPFLVFDPAGPDCLVEGPLHHCPRPLGDGWGKPDLSDWEKSARVKVVGIVAKMNTENEKEWSK